MKYTNEKIIMEMAVSWNINDAEQNLYKNKGTYAAEL